MMQTMACRHTLRSQNALLRMFPSAGFAKYTRDKPHLNVGTIGKSSLSSLFLDIQNLMCGSQATRLLSMLAANI